MLVEKEKSEFKWIVTRNSSGYLLWLLVSVIHLNVVFNQEDVVFNQV